MRVHLTVAAVAAAAAAAYAVPTTAATPARQSAPAADSTSRLLEADPVTYVDVDTLLGAEAVTLADVTHDHSTHAHDGTAPAAAAPRATARRLSYGRWRTPEAAMRHLTRAYNAKDAQALKDVTTPDARTLLNDMRTWAPDLRLVSCTDTKAGSFDCSFTHSIKGSAKGGTATLRVAPARKQGWYATVVVDCG